nr:MAG: replication associated protein [Cressdnaviricota sp.]
MKIFSCAWAMIHPSGINVGDADAVTGRFQGKRVFLTYPMCPLDINVMYAELEKIENIQFACIAREMHESGDFHIHAVVEFKDRVRGPCSTVFNILDYHPNIQIPRNWNACLAYVRKDNDFINFGDATAPSKSKKDSLFDVANTMAHNDYFDYCRNENIQFAYAQLAWSNRNSMFTLNSSGSRKGTIRFDLGCLSLEQEEDDIRCIVITGSTGIGKTTHVREQCRKPALFVTHMDGLRKLRPEHQSIVFDDMSFLHVPREAQIQLVDRSVARQIHVRYGIVEIPEGIQKIFTANQEPFIDDDAINRRLNKFHFI